MSLRDVVVIGGGLSGLVAAHTLEQAKVNYTIIEVKPRFGGSIGKHTEAGFIADSGAMVHQIRDHARFADYLAKLELEDAIESHGDGIIFKQGTQVLIDALAQQLTAPRMMRMAVSTLGEMYGTKRFSICMENGMLLDSRALIVTSPARYAERMFHTLIPDISYKLLDYQYDTIARLSLGYQGMDMPTIPKTLPKDSPIVAIQHTTHLERIPEDGMLVQLAIRFDPSTGISDDLITQAQEILGWKATPTMIHLSAWSESDPIMWQTPNHAERLADINQLLPAGVALIGSDYIPTADVPCLDECIALAQQSTQQITQWIK